MWLSEPTWRAERAVATAAGQPPLANRHAARRRAPQLPSRQPPLAAAVGQFPKVPVGAIRHFPSADLPVRAASLARRPNRLAAGAR
jgi:hypothetical protein